VKIQKTVLICAIATIPEGGESLNEKELNEKNLERTESGNTSYMCVSHHTYAFG
jgi:hypothetical protein